MDPNFVEGRVTGIDGSILRVTGSDGSLHRIRLTDGTSVWKLRPITMDRIDVGDGMYARGVRITGELAAESVWVNIVNLTVHIDSISANTVHVDHHGNKIVCRVVPRHERRGVQQHAGGIGPLDGQGRSGRSNRRRMEARHE